MCIRLYTVQLILWLRILPFRVNHFDDDVDNLFLQVKVSIILHKYKNLLQFQCALQRLPSHLHVHQQQQEKKE